MEERVFRGNLSSENKVGKTHQTHYFDTSHWSLCQEIFQDGYKGNETNKEKLKDQEEWKEKNYTSLTFLGNYRNYNL